jgi:serine/threonine protein kinase
MDADRNLLFGILAFQLSLIDRQALLTAFDRWTADKQKPLGDILVEMDKLDRPRCQLLDALVAEHLKLHGNDAEKSLAAITTVGSVRDDLKQLADPHIKASLAYVSMAPASGNLDVTLSWTAGNSTSAGTRFRVLRPHARGGLGEVFVAEDQELHREVALKEIQEQHADNPDSRSRFLLEAEVTGCLEHPSIVPVYGLGNYPDGRPFYAMRFIKGDSLKEAIKRFHAGRASGGRQPPVPADERTAELRKLLGRFIDVCNAIEYAHSRGVLHRDLKPGNIMLGNYGETLVVDWGLAKVIGRSEAHAESEEQTLHPVSADGSAATQMGHALGTPQYMSPEQAAGRWDELGRESDVYSLGATLYTLLTGRAPIAEGESMDVLARAVKGDFAAPRTVDKEIPPALEAICLKAMALKPADRYGSPRALADDIERWLNDQPVSVHHEPLPQRFARWRRNHKAHVAAMAAAVVVLAVGGIAASAIARRANERTQNMTRAAGLVDSLLKADPQQVPEILKQLGENAEFARPMLAEELAQAQDGSTEKLHLSLALVGSDDAQVAYLYEQLLSRHASYIAVIRDQLAPYQEPFQAELWDLLHDATKDFSRRFRAGLALATFATASEQWTLADIVFLAQQLVAANPEHQPRLRECLRPISGRLLVDLERIFGDPKSTDAERLSAANAFADYAGSDVPKLTQLLAVATPPQHAVLYPIVAATPAPSVLIPPPQLLVHYNVRVNHRKSQDPYLTRR